MTYCIGAALDKGMIFASDSRTNAGMGCAHDVRCCAAGRGCDARSYFQAGQTKYGKPLIDRVIARVTPLADATKCVLVSFDLTRRSNLSVGMPIDLICHERDRLEAQRRRRFDEGDAYFAALSHEWSEGTREVFRQLPEPGW
jgi:predicted proteasome-type protease